MSFKTIFLSLLKDGAVRRAICSATASCNNGGSSFPTAQTVSSDAPISTLQTNYVYTYTGTNPSTWGLPASNTSPGSRIVIINKSAEDLTINAASTGDIYATGSEEDSIIVSPGTVIEFLDDGSSQVVI